jgi:hypothetical protein
LLLELERKRAGGREKEKKRRRRRRKKPEGKRKIFARTTSGDDLREQIDRDAFALRSYASYRLRSGGKRKRKGKKKWQCSLLVEAKVLYEKSRFHRLMLSMIMTFSRERERKKKG